MQDRPREQTDLCCLPRIFESSATPKSVAFNIVPQEIVETMSLDYSTNRFSPLSCRHRETDRGVSCGTRVSSTLSGVQGQTAVFNFKLPTAPAPVRVLCCLHPLFVVRTRRCGILPHL